LIEQSDDGMNKVGGPARERRVTGHLPSPHYVPPENYNRGHLLPVRVRAIVGFGQGSDVSDCSFGRGAGDRGAHILHSERRHPWKSDVDAVDCRLGSGCTKRDASCP